MTDITNGVTSSWDAIKAAHALDGSAERLKEYYRDWSSDYDHDVKNQGYIAPVFLADFLPNLHRHDSIEVDVLDPALPILDAGCGTGLVGVALKERGYSNVEGFDLSNEMADAAAQTGAYRAVRGGVDLCRPIDLYEDEQFAAILCCGVFTLGHVPPSAMRELVPMTRRGGIVAVTTRKSYYEESDFGTECRKLEDEGLVTLIDSIMDGPYIKEEGAHYWAFKRN